MRPHHEALIRECADLRRTLGHTRTEAARIAGLSRGHLWKLETGAVDVCGRIAEYGLRRYLEIARREAAQREET